MTDPAILIVEDDATQRDMLRRFLASEGYTLVEAGCVEEARAALASATPSLVLTDYQLPDGNGMDVLRMARRTHPDLQVVLITAYGTIDVAVEAMREGAADVLLKPVDPPVLLDRVRRSLRLRSLEHENATLRRKLDRLTDPAMPVAESAAMQTVLDQVRRIAPTRTTVLVGGETGTGKEVVARLLHAWGTGPDGPFVTTDCGALTETLLESELFGHAQGAFTGATTERKGRFEAADGGTLFLDEIAEMPLDAQTRLLRVLEAREVVRLGETTPRPIDVRVIAATHRDLAEEVRAGRFREDLRFRIEVVTLHIPPLRERPDDVPPLAERFAAEIAHHRGAPAPSFSDEALALLRAYDYPGNVRELRNVVERVLLLTESATISAATLAPLLRDAPDEPPRALEGALHALEVRMIRDALRRAGGIQTRAAAELGVAERVLRYKMKKHGIRRRETEESDGRRND